jgi:class 3 adenylate cyclase
VSPARKKSLDSPDDSVEFGRGRSEWVALGDMTVGRTTAQPGWRWSTHIRPIVGGEWCQSRHVGVVVSGRLGCLLQDGTELEFAPNEVFDIPPGHDGYVVGEEPAVTIEWSGIRGWLEPLESLNERVLATIVFTDIVDSTALAERLGGSRWNDLLGRHNARMREVILQFRGREVKTTGDGFLAMFDGAARAVRCAARMVRAAPDDGIQIRAAVHTGELEVVGNDVQGVTVHEAARVLAVAAPSEVLVTSVTRELAGPSEARFVERGEHMFKGLESPRRLFALADA